jgi:hypothetical protein
MADRTKLLVHFRRLSTVFQNAVAHGPDGSLTGKFETEHPIFVHYACAFYLAGCLAFLEGEDGAYSWNRRSASYADFDQFVDSYPPVPKASYAKRGVNKAALHALACVRNAVIHHDGDLAQNRDRQCLGTVAAAHLPGVILTGSVVRLEAAFLGFVRLAALAVRNYYGET